MNKKDDEYNNNYGCGNTLYWAIMVGIAVLIMAIAVTAIFIRWGWWW